MQQYCQAKLFVHIEIIDHDKHSDKLIFDIENNAISKQRSKSN